jgi:hypothetical protein
MNRRTIIGVALAMITGVAIPFGLPHSVSAAGYNTLVISPLPIAQPGTLTASQVVDLCVQPENAGTPPTHVAGTVWLSIASGKFTSPPAPGGTAVVGTTALSGTPQSFATSATCTSSGGSVSKNAVLVVYSAPATLPPHGRDIIVAADTSADSGSNGVCGAGVCDTGTYVFSPVASYLFSLTPIAATGTLTAGQSVALTVTALDNSATPQPVPGAYLNLSIGNAGGTATAFNAISGKLKTLTNSPQRVGALSSGSVSITYSAANPLPSSGVDTITAQNHPAATVTSSTTYTYATSTAPPSNPYTAVTPFRVCDTRPAVGGVPSNQCNTGNTGAGSGPIGSGLTRVITVVGFGTVPSGVTAVVVNVTAIAPTKATFLTLYPDLTTNPRTSNLNPLAGEVVANLVEVGVSAAGKIDLFNDLGTINVAVDIEGYVAAASPGLFVAASTPVRICDTRQAGGGIPANRCNVSGASPIGTNTTLTFNVNGSGSPVPGTAVSAVVFNLTGIGPTRTTDLTAYTGVTRPTASNLNINAGASKAVANRVIVPVTCSGGNCTVSIWNSVGSINIAVDIDGWFTTSGASFTALSRPARVCDTRIGNINDQGCTRGLVGAGRVLNIAVTNIDNIPTSATAIVANVTVVNATSATFVTVYPGPSTAGRPNASDINVASFQPVPNLVVVGVGPSGDGTINLFNDLGSVNLIVDVLGYYS